MGNLVYLCYQYIVYSAVLIARSSPNCIWSFCLPDVISSWRHLPASQIALMLRDYFFWSFSKTDRFDIRSSVFRSERNDTVIQTIEFVGDRTVQPEFVALKFGNSYGQSTDVFLFYCYTEFIPSPSSFCRTLSWKACHREDGISLPKGVELFAVSPSLNDRLKNCMFRTLLCHAVPRGRYPMVCSPEYRALNCFHCL